MKMICKALANGIATLLVLPAFLGYCLARVCLGAQHAFPGWSQAFGLLPGLTGIYLRRAFYRLVLPRCDSDACISFGVLFSHPTARIGQGTYVGPYGSLGDVTLEADVLLGSHVSVTNGSQQHGTERLDMPVREQPGLWPHVTIGQDTWVGDRAIIMADVGKQCVIGAGAVVTKPIPDYAIAHGVPARVVGYRKGSPGRSGEPSRTVPSLTLPARTEAES
jgi:virginiamycin A acetyltransferase